MRTTWILTLTMLAACSGGSSGSGAGVCPPKLSKQDLPGLPGGSGTGLPGTGLPGTGGAGGAMTEVSSFGDNPGNLRMFLHTPKGASEARAVVLALHGCTQGAREYAGAGWNDLADKANVAVVYAEQSTTNNGQRCFRWYDQGHNSRDRGEARSLASMVEHARSKLGASRAYVTGLSAGGAMAVVMLASYPELFEAGAIMAGLPYGCATSQLDAFTCMSGRDKSADAWAALVPEAAKAKRPRVSVWQGQADYLVRPTNETQIVRQWAAINGISAEDPSATETVGVATRSVFKDASGQARVESWTIPKMGHGVAVASKEGCGTAGAFLLDVGVCSTHKAAQFFGIVDASGAPMDPGPSGSSSGSPSDCE